MSMRQKIDDLVLLLKEDRKAQVIAVVVAVFLVWGIMGDSTPRRGQRVAEQQQAETVGTGSMAPQEAYDDLVSRFSADLEIIKEQTVQNAEMNQELRTNIGQYEERTAEIFKKIIERIADMEASRTSAGALGQVPVGVGPEEYQSEAFPEDSLEPWGNLDEAEVAPPPPPAPRKVAVIGAGDSVQVKLLAGVNAPTDGTPYPVVFKLVDAVDGPDSSALPLGEARLIAAAQGSLSDQRALFRLTQLNVRYPDGSRKITPVDGWIVGEDGLRGMEGILIDPIGKALFGSLLAGTVEGLGDGLASAQISRNFNNDGSGFERLDGDVFDFALGRGASEAGDSWNRFIEQRIRLLVPHVKVLSGRTATAVFAKTVTLDGLFDALEDGDNVFVSLD